MTLPEEFSKYTRELFGEELWQQFVKVLDEEPPVSIRLNPFKFDAATMPLPAEEDGEVEWCPEGRYLKSRPQFTLDPLLHAGAYYVQEAASMYVARVLRRHADMSSPLRVLDLCAAPGGKTTTARSVLPEGSLLMANEPMRPRANILMENMQKFGHPDVIVTNNYAIDYQRSGLQFDVIICDVPCSGEGMFRKDEGAIGEWSVANVKKCAALQREIIADIMPCLRDGGLLIYSTCTFNAHEDEENVKWITDTYDMQLLDISDENMKLSTLSPLGEPEGAVGALHFIPGVTRTEGLFMAAMRKPGEGNNLMATSADRKKEKKQKRGKQMKQQPVQGAKQVAEWLSDSGDFDITMLGGRIVGVKKMWRNVFDTACDKLRVMHAGVELGEQKGKDIIPSESLALSISLNREAFPIAELDRNAALDYLRREPIALPADMPRGYVVVSYMGLALGFVKNLGNRTNNLFPQEWRIRKGPIPAQPLAASPSPKGEGSRYSGI